MQMEFMMHSAQEEVINCMALLIKSAIQNKLRFGIETCSSEFS